MATPSEKTIHHSLDVTPSQAREIKKALVAADRGGHVAVNKALEFTNAVTEAHGVEAIHGEHFRGGYYADIIALFVNMGDAYSATLLYDVIKDRFYITSWADWAEEEERAGRMIPNGRVAGKLTCDMESGCKEPVTHIDTAGYVYCAKHGAQRKTYESCRKLRPAEIKKLQEGEALRRYSSNANASPEAAKKRGEKYTVEDMLSWGWIDEDDAELLRKEELKEDRLVEKIQGKTTRYSSNGRRAAHKLAPGTSVRIYDDGGNADRYTVVMVGKDWDASARPGYKTMLGLSEGGRGFSQWTDGQEGRHLGKSIRWEDLDSATRKHIEARVLREP